MLRSSAPSHRRYSSIEDKTKSATNTIANALTNTLADITNINNSINTSINTSINNNNNALLTKPFKIPFNTTRFSDSMRKRKRVNYAQVQHINGVSVDDILGEKDVNQISNISNIPIFKPKDSTIVLRKKFKVPISSNSSLKENLRPDYEPPPPLGTKKKFNSCSRPLHDPTAEFAIILYDPTIDSPPLCEEPENEKNKPPQEIVEVKKPSVHKSLAEILGIPKQINTTEKPKVAVVIDPKLAKVLRPHQVEGVKFLYRCTTGLIDQNAHGCIMADEMGLGKTLQCITLLWTLLRQSPTPGKPTISKCIIACPSSLVRNWANELTKWLGNSAPVPFAIDGKCAKAELITQLQQWAIASGRAVVRPVLIVSYETLRLYVNYLAQTEVGLLLCDEGHRLKNGDSLTFNALDSLNVQRRVILSGTPIQNDLSEYFSLLNFANPGYLGSRAEFRKNYELPILRGRDANGTESDREKGDQKLSELTTLVHKFIIRRTNDILSKYLPVKYEHVVFCNLSSFQRDLYRHFLSCYDIKSILKKSNGTKSLKSINILKKLCSHPDLLNLQKDLEGCEKYFPSDYTPKNQRSNRDRIVYTQFSGKMMVLERMLRRIHTETDDKIVLISNYTQTLDLLEQFCFQNKYGCLRLDGKMGIGKRQKLVDKFNDPESGHFVFLLSSKAGGCGINLIGANRLILFDPDWNPAADQQALARVWRDGQKKDCFVYRFIATGTIEEKIFQRQSMKQSLSSCVVDEAQDVERHFSNDDLRQLFEFKPETLCDTHDTFKCSRCKDGEQVIKAPAILYGDTSTWNHFSNKRLEKIEDLLLRQESSLDVVSYAFQYISH